MSVDSDSDSVVAQEETTSGRRACFDATFFSGILGERARALCAQKPDRIAVVLLHLADGAVLDLCHIDQLFPDWMAARVYRDPKACERMELVFVPYVFITRVTMFLPSVQERRIGFQTEAASPQSVSKDRE
ncbi:MAG TPA: hypothetical protein VLK65_05870 [Vicinamibacteria bacterium]|nr:hypothetical protein [Vicinamibacteria bacterium]